MGWVEIGLVVVAQFVAAFSLLWGLAGLVEAVDDPADVAGFEILAGVVALAFAVLDGIVLAVAWPMGGRTALEFLVGAALLVCLGALFTGLERSDGGLVVPGAFGALVLATVELLLWTGVLYAHDSTDRAPAPPVPTTAAAPTASQGSSPAVAPTPVAPTVTVTATVPPLSGGTSATAPVRPGGTAEATPVPTVTVTVTAGPTPQTTAPPSARATASDAAPPPPSRDDSGGAPPWISAVGALLVGIAALLALRRPSGGARSDGNSRRG
ncbi:hypothetical protein [Kitasatospora sp. NPDC004289]